MLIITLDFSLDMHEKVRLPSISQFYLKKEKKHKKKTQLKTKLLIQHLRYYF